MMMYLCVCVCVCVCVILKYNSLPASSLPTASCKLYKLNHILKRCNPPGKSQHINVVAQRPSTASKVVSVLSVYFVH
jgi:hypothetical protein